MITIYTMPNCGICHMIKTRLQDKGISFEEDDIMKIAEELDIDRAPVLKINSATFLTSPTDMIDWINKQ